jgi:SlyX protein
MNELENRVNDLEVKYSFQDELVNELNLLVAAQQEKIEELTKAIKELVEQSSEHGNQNSSLKNERPPHY